MGFFNDINDALGGIGKELKSPAWSSVDSIKSAATAMQMGSRIDSYAMQQAFPDDYSSFADTIGAVDQLSADLTKCGDYAGDALQAATTDFIKNTGIQQAGRELSNKLGKGSDMLDCVAGFATLFDSKGVLDDAMGLADLPQIQDRVQQVINDATNPAKLSNVIMNMDIIQGLLGDAQGICDSIHSGMDKLISKDLATIIDTMNKLSQWAAFAKMATSDPCGLVNNNKMLSHITEPVMDDIISLYKDATSGLPALADVTDVAAPAFSPEAAITNPNFRQAAQEGAMPFSNYLNALPAFGGSGKSCVCHGGDPMDTNEGDCLANGGRWVCTETKTVPMEFDSDSGKWEIPDTANEAPNGAVAGMPVSPVGFADKILGGNNPLNDAVAQFASNKELVDFAPELAGGIGNNGGTVAVGNCSGGDASQFMSRNDKAGCEESGGTWSVNTMTANEFKEMTSPEGIASSTFSGGGAGSGKDAPALKPVAATKPRAPAVVGAASSSPVAKITPVKHPSSPSRSAASAPDIPIDFAELATGIFNKAGDGAKFQFGNDALSGGFNDTLDKIKTAEATGDYSNIETCNCHGGSDFMASTEAACKAGGGRWKCQPGTEANTRFARSILSGGTNSTKKNKELSSILPTNKAFDVSKIV